MSTLRVGCVAALCFAIVLLGSARGEAEQVIHGFVTFYGYDDNDDGNPAHTGTEVISDPSVHDAATEDLGTYDHPGTLAADKSVISPGSMAYIPALQRYYVMEDTCRACSLDWSNGKVHVDVFVDGTGTELAECENRLTMEVAEIIIDPPRGLAVRRGSACDASRPPAADGDVTFTAAEPPGR